MADKDGKWRNRIVEQRVMRVGDLAVNKWNPKRHGAQQTARMEAVLEKFGVVQGLVAYRSERAGGQLCLFDGHMRQKLDPDAEWLVSIVDLDDSEVDALVLFFDEMAAQSDKDDAMWAALATEKREDVGDGVLGEFLAEMAEEAGFLLGAATGQGRRVARGVAGETGAGVGDTESQRARQSAPADVRG
jgi:hypothetical protein